MTNRRLTPYLLLAPGIAFLAVFFVVPLYYLANTSLQTGSIDVGYSLTWAWGNYSDALSTYRPQFVRSIQYAALATFFALRDRLPAGVLHRGKAGKWKNFLLLLVIAPFFVTYLIRTLAWQTILADEGMVMDVLRTIGVMGETTGCSPRRPRSSRASRTTSCRSWCSRSTRAWSSSTRG